MNRWLVLLLSLLFFSASPPVVIAQDVPDRAAVVLYLQGRLAKLNDAHCARPLIEAQGRVGEALARADEATDRRDNAYDNMIPGDGLFDYYLRQKREAERDKTKAEEKAIGLARQVPGARSEVVACLEGM